MYLAKGTKKKRNLNEEKKLVKEIRAKYSCFTLNMEKLKTELLPELAVAKFDDYLLEVVTAYDVGLL
jgi:hypothetical protein